MVLFWKNVSPLKRKNEKWKWINLGSLPAMFSCHLILICYNLQYMLLLGGESLIFFINLKSSHLQLIQRSSSKRRCWISLWYWVTNTKYKYQTFILSWHILDNRAKKSHVIANSVKAGIPAYPAGVLPWRRWPYFGEKCVIIRSF